MASLLLVADALKRVLDGVEPLPAEDAALVEAEGRVLAAGVARAASRIRSVVYTASRCWCVVRIDASDRWRDSSSSQMSRTRSVHRVRSVGSRSTARPG